MTRRICLRIAASADNEPPGFALIVSVGRLITDFAVYASLGKDFGSIAAIARPLRKLHERRSIQLSLPAGRLRKRSRSPPRCVIVTIGQACNDILRNTRILANQIVE
jgi:hypothetical protein